MSTRSAIARPAGDGWEGRYHHFDGYPTGLGRTLWKAYHEHFRGDLGAMHRFLIDDHPAGWSSINDADLSQPAGYASGDGPQCYCHGQRSEEPSDLFRCLGPTVEVPGRHARACSGEDCDPLFIEWAYVLAATGMEVFASRGYDQPGTVDSIYQRLDGTTEVMPKRDYRHVSVAFVPWGGDEPDWAALEDAARTEE